MITPNDIETKVFSYSVRGYNKREVDEFLDQIMIDYQALLDQNAKMLERVHVLQKQVSEAKDPAKMTKDAERLMSDISASAEQKAEVIIKNAQHDAANIVKNAKNSTSQADEDAERLRQKVEKFKLRFKQMLEDEMERVDDTSEDLLDDLRKDFYPAFLYGDGEAADYTKVANATPAEDLIAELPDVEPEDEEPAVEVLEEEQEEGQGAVIDEQEEAEPEDDGSAEPEEEPQEEEPQEETGGEAGEESLEGEPSADADEPEEAAEPEEEIADAEETEPLEEVPEESEEQGEKVEEVQEAEETSKEGEAPTIEDEELQEEAEAEDPLLARAKDANVDIDDLPGFRSSASSTDDTIVLKKLKNDSTVDLTPDMKSEETESASIAQQTKEKAKELKGAATKLVNDLFSKNDN